MPANQEDWNRDRACMRCYTQKLKCRRPPNQPTCIRCTKLRVQCRPRPPKERCDTGRNEFTMPTAPITPHERTSFPSPATSYAKSSDLLTPLPLLNQSVDLMIGTNGECIDSSLVNPIEPGDQHSHTFLSAGFESDVTMGIGSAGFATDLPDLAEFTNWQEHTFNPHGFEQRISCAPSYTYKDPASTKGSRVELQRCSDLGQSVALDNTQPLSDWVNDLAKLNTFICSRNTTTFAVSSRGYVGDGQNSRSEAGGERCGPDFEATFQMAVELVKMVGRLHTGRASLPHIRSDGGNEHSSEHPGANQDERSQIEQQISQIVNDSSNIMLLTSTYGRLLGHLKCILQSVKAETTSDLRISIGNIDLSSRPDTQSFVLVNVVELLVRRIDRVLKSVIKEIEASIGTAPGPVGSDDDDDFERRRSRYQSNFNVFDRDTRGLGLVLHVLSEQQSALLKSTSELRAQLLSGID